MNELQPIFDALIAKWPWMMKLAMWIGFARLAIKPIGLWLKSIITTAAEKAIGSASPWDDHWLELLTGWQAWRLFVFLLDLFASVKLPVREDLFKPPTAKP